MPISTRTLADDGKCVQTVKFLENTLDCAGAATTSHGDVELVRVSGHCAKAENRQ